MDDTFESNFVPADGLDGRFWNCRCSIWKDDGPDINLFPIYRSLQEGCLIYLGSSKNALNCS